MLVSMTGFGKRSCNLPGKSINIQIRSLNCKQLDINTKIPGIYKEKDMEIRKLIAEKMIRGKIELNFYLEITGDESNYRLNKEIAKRYYQDLKELETDLGMQKEADYLEVLVRMPDVLKTELQELDAEEWKQIKQELSLAIDELNAFREQEGMALEKDIKQNIHTIQKLLQDLAPFEEARMKNIKERIHNDLNKQFNETHIDKNRFEQELFYYIEKLDINEEKVRLKKHCEYFLEMVDQKSSQGKKLGFIAQEIGREINTLGSKANEANIQQIVVNMKDELEKIKEQLLNVL